MSGHTPNIWRKINLTSGLLVIAAIFVTAFFVAGIEIKDLDLWLHLAAGKFMTEHQFIPLDDIFSNRMGGMHWNNHEWLFQVLLYNIHHQWGVPGLLNMQIAVVLLTLSFLFFIGYSRDRQLLSCFLLLLVYLVYQQRFTLRPDLFSLLFFVLYIYILSHCLHKKWAPYALIVVQLFWVNMHGFFIFGPLFVFIALISEWMKRHIPLPYEWNEAGRLDDGEYNGLGKIFIFVSLACLINPHFVTGALYPLKILTSVSGDQSIFFDYISELQKPITRETLWSSSHFAFYKLIILITFVSFVYNRRNIDLSALLIWGMFLFISLKAMRNIPFFAFAAFFVILNNLYNVSFNDVIPIRFSDKKFKDITEAFVKLLLLFWIFNFSTGFHARSYYDFKNYERKKELGGVSLRSFPNEAADFLVDNNIKGNFFNDFNSGAYLIGRTFPNIRVFMDGRTELYGAENFKIAHKQMWLKGNKSLLDSNIEKFQLSGAFLNSAQSEIPDETLNYFYKNPDWTLVYFNYDAVIFLKNIPENRMWIDQYGFDLKDWRASAFDLFKMGTASADPVEHVNRAFTLEAVGLLDLAEAQAQTALGISPNSAGAFKVLGKVYAKRKDFQTAHDYFRQAAVLRPSSIKIRYNLGLSLLDMNEYQEAVYLYTQILNKWPEEVQAAFFLAKAHALNHEPEGALKALDQALNMDPGAVGDALEIGDIFLKRQLYQDAVDIYQLLALRKDTTGQVHYKLAQSYQALGNETSAKVQILKALELTPDNADFQKLSDSLN